MDWASCPEFLPNMWKDIFLSIKTVTTVNASGEIYKFSIRMNVGALNFSFKL